MSVRYLQDDFETVVEFEDGLYCPIDFLVLDDEESSPF